MYILKKQKERNTMIHFFSVRVFFSSFIIRYKYGIEKNFNMLFIYHSFRFEGIHILRVNHILIMLNTHTYITFYLCTIRYLIITKLISLSDAYSLILPHKLMRDTYLLNRHVPSLSSYIHFLF